MAFKEVTSLDAEVTVALGKTNKATGKPYPKQAEGYFLGSREVENKRGKSSLHFLQTPKGNLGIWGTTDLNRKLGQATVGSMVRITSTGTKPTPNGDMYTYKVEIDSDNSIEVETQQASSGSDYSSENTEQDADESDYNESVDEDVQALAVDAQRAERQAKVRAALNSKSRKV